MYTLFTDKSDVFECDLKLEGASISKSQCRLLIESDDFSLLFNGSINESGQVKIPIKKLKNILEENKTGNLKLEVIADGDSYFTPWEEKFIVKTNKKASILEVRSKNNANITETKTISATVKTKFSEKQNRDILKETFRFLIENKITFSNFETNKEKVFNHFSKLNEKHNFDSDTKNYLIENTLVFLKKR